MRNETPASLLTTLNHLRLCQGLSIRLAPASALSGYPVVNDQLY